MKRIILSVTALMFLGAGCFSAITVPQVAETLVPAQEAGNIVKTSDGFGNLPALPTAPVGNTGIIRINADLPSLQKQVSVLRVPSGAMSATQLQNLTTSFNLPIGIVGEPKTQEFNLTWTNNENIAWTFAGGDKKIRFKDTTQSVPKMYAQAWPDQIRAVQAARDFLVLHGFNDKNLQNLDIASDWKSWKSNLESNKNCMDRQSVNYILNYTYDPEKMFAPPLVYGNMNCADTLYPALLPITFERIVDQRNVLSQNGAPDIGGKLLYNTYSGKIYSGWILTQPEPQRSDYTAISEKEMRNSLEKGGLSGLPQGNADIQTVDFAFYRFPASAYQPEILVPALVGDGFQTIYNQKIPYRVVVPLTKE